MSADKQLLYQTLRNSVLGGKILAWSLRVNSDICKDFNEILLGKASQAAKTAFSHG